ncbi:MAG: hypothetical protein IJO10_05505 [Clostridia bacterium]|nr:hypothetical protein [Clostridia bacterium]
MGTKIDLSSKLNFADIDLTAPNTVVEEIANQIADETNNIVQGKVATFSGHVYSYTQSGLAGLSAALGTVEKRVDIQTTLGKQGEEKHKYEFYLSTPAYPSYKYRVCYLQYGISNYPVNVILEQHIADDVYSESDAGYIIKCNTRAELEELIVKVIYSKRIIGVMQELIHINQVHRGAGQEEYESVGALGEEQTTD